MSDYDCVARTSLKLKASLAVTKKDKRKKKKKDKLEPKMVEKAMQSSSDLSEPATTTTTSGQTATDKRNWMTEAEKKFLAQQEKRQLSRVMEKASKSHKQRVEEFNTQLENLSEHYDIPKVSWTK